MRLLIGRDSGLAPQRPAGGPFLYRSRIKGPAALVRSYQQRLLRAPEVQTAMKEFKQSWDEFGIANWKPPAL
jgi:hypothetical protein